MSTLEQLTDQLLDSPTSRARFLAQTLELLERNGVDLTSEALSGLVSADISDRESFENSMAANTVAIVIGSAGQRGIGAVAYANTNTVAFGGRGSASNIDTAA